MTPTRPALRWHGGKWKLAPWIIGFFPPHKIYVEPFGGAASVLLRKERAITEVYNDLDGDAVNLFRVMRDRTEDLARLLALTPYAREEYLSLYESTGDPVERARRFVARSFMGQSSKGALQRSGFDTRVNEDAFSSRLRSLAAMPDELAAIAGRLTHVIIEQEDGLTLMRRHDRPDCLHYVDPPYLPRTRSAPLYRHEMSTRDHETLLAGLMALSGMVVLSGYPDDLYDRTLVDWRRLERDAFADGGRARTEVVWINPACAGLLDLDRAQQSFGFEGAA